MIENPLGRWRMNSVISIIFAGLLVSSYPAFGADPAESLPNGQFITPAAAHGAVFQPLSVDLPGLPGHLADHAEAEALSPDGKTLLILTSGYNRMRDADGKAAPQWSNEYVFVYDVTGASPRRQQVLQLPNTFLGLAWRPDGNGFYVSGGPDDNIHSFMRGQDGYAESGQPIPLGHTTANGAGVKAVAARIAVSPAGTRLLVTNYENDSVTLVDLEQRKVVHELDLRPGKLDARNAGVAGGESPIGVAWIDDRKAYVIAQRDREAIMIHTDMDRISVGQRIKIQGSPNALLFDPARARLYVAAGDDTVSEIDTAGDRLDTTFRVALPEDIFPNPRTLKGSDPNGLALSPDGRALFVTLNGMNAVAVVSLPAAGADKGKPVDDDGDGDAPARSQPRVAGLVPTGWEPTAVTVGADGTRLFIVNSKSNPGPNPGNCRDSTMKRTTPGAMATFNGQPGCMGANQYVLNLEKAGFLQMPVPDAAELARLTRQVATNDGIAQRAGKDPLMTFLHAHIKHVIYVVKENRTYDQLFGDFEIGNGDPGLEMFPEQLTPNNHALARYFVTLDSFFDSGSVSMDGWEWSTSARTTDFTEKNMPMTYSGRARSNDSQGMSRGMNVAVPHAERHALNEAVPDDPDILPGTINVAAPDAADGEAGAGYIWNAAVKAGLSLRNYGFFDDLTSIANAMMRDSKSTPGAPDPTIPPHEPFKEGRTIYHASNASLIPYSDPYYSGADLRYPDFWRIQEWRRDFADLVARKAIPSLMLVSLPHDHFGTFNAAIDRVDTVEKQIADNDYALGMLVDTIAKSPIHDDTLIFVVEDDAQDGADHVNAHRTVSYIFGPYVKHHALVSKRYTTVSLLRTIEDVLGIPHMGLHDEFAEPMRDVFDMNQSSWSYDAVVPGILGETDLPLPKQHASRRLPEPACSRWRTMDYWQSVLGDQDYSGLDRLDTDRFNAALWKGMKGEKTPMPIRSGRDLRNNRQELLAAYRPWPGCGALRGGLGQ
jgi:DNA-binding beta-propeller fold protein YncE